MLARKRKFGLLFAIIAIFALVATACGDDDGGDDNGGDGEATATTTTEGGGGNKDVSIAFIPWDEDIAISNLWKAALEERGYTVELEQADVGPIYEGVSNGDFDMFLDAWLPTTHEQYWARYKDDIEDLGIWYEGATLNVTVPSYVDADSLEDLPDMAEDFDNKIVGIDPGAGLTAATKDKVIPEYGLDDAGMTLQTSSTAAMLTQLKDAIDNEEPIVVTLWHPHWAYAAYDLKDLEDPKGTLGTGEELHLLGRTGFAEDFPELAEVAKNFKMSDEDLASLENMIQEAGDDDPMPAVQSWMEENKDVVDKAFGSLGAAN